jgi:acetylornithine deacetylase
MTNLPTRDQLAAAVAARRGWAIEALAALVREPTVLGDEASGQACVARLLESLGFEPRHEPVDTAAIAALPGFSPVDWEMNGKANVVAVHEPGTNAGRSLAFNGHIDVVSAEPVSLWTSPPFEPRVVEGEEDGETWMYGRGTGDMKGGTVSALWSLAALRDLGLEPASRLVFQSPVEEECTGNGTLALLSNGHVADACVIPEPFNETILRRQVGVIWFKVRVLGSTTHVLAAGSGVNAIEKSWVIIRALRQLEDELNLPENVPASYRGVEHPVNLNVGIIEGGDWASTVAGECVTHFRLGLFAEQSCDEIRRRIERCVREAAAADPWLRESPPTVEYGGFQAEGCECDIDGDFGRILQETHREWRGTDADELRATCTSDVRHFSLYHDIPVTCYGPVARNIHGVDEKVSIDSMQRVAEVLADFTGRWCGLQRRST